MKLHIVFDFMHIYYKYYFQLREGRIKRLYFPLDWNGDVIERDISSIYYPLRDIEGIRRNLEEIGHDVTVSVCFDMPSHRKDDGVAGGDLYKSGRKNKLSEDDFKNLQYIETILRDVGHNTYKIDGYEADDLINHLTTEFKDEFDYTIIYTNDKDLLININEKVGVMRYKQSKGYQKVSVDNYEEYLENEFKVFIPYNALGLFLSTAGDSADKIKGINKFGPAAFKKLITKVSTKHNIDWKKCGNYSELEKILPMCEEFLTEEQFKQMNESFILVSNIQLIGDIEKPIKQSNKELREKVYSRYNMNSLIQ